MNIKLEKTDTLLDNGSIQYLTAATLTAYYLNKGRYPAKTDLPGCDYLLSYRKYLQVFGSWGLAKSNANILLSTNSPDSINTSVFGIKEVNIVIPKIDDNLGIGSLLLSKALISKKYVSYEYYDRISIEERLEYIKEYANKRDLEIFWNDIDNIGIPLKNKVQLEFDNLIFNNLNS